MIFLHKYNFYTMSCINFLHIHPMICYHMKFGHISDLREKLLLLSSPSFHRLIFSPLFHIFSSPLTSKRSGTMQLQKQWCDESQPPHHLHTLLGLFNKRHVVKAPMVVVSRLVLKLVREFVTYNFSFNHGLSRGSSI